MSATGAAQAVALLLTVLDAAGQPDDAKEDKDDDGDG